MLNKLLKQLPDSNDIESLKAKSAMLPLFNLCRNYQSKYCYLKQRSDSSGDVDDQPKKTAKGKSVRPSRIREKKTLFLLFSKVDPFGYEGEVRNLDNNIVWKHVPAAQAYLQELISIDKKQSNITADNNEEHPSSTEDDIDSEEESAMDSIELDQDQDETGSEIDSYHELSYDGEEIQDDNSVMRDVMSDNANYFSNALEESNTSESLSNIPYAIYQPKIYESKTLKEQGLALLGSTKDLEMMRKKDEYKGEQRRLIVEEARSLARIRATKRLKLLSGLGGNGSPAPTVRNNLLWNSTIVWCIDLLNALSWTM